MDDRDSEAALSTEWNNRYAGLPHLPSHDQPNALLAAEFDELVPGRALDVGCGTGSDAVWLARHEWDVTAIDVSTVALERAAARSQDAGVDVHWKASSLAEAASLGQFDLVTAFYPAWLQTDWERSQVALLEAVAAEGLLLIVHHADVDVATAKAHGFDPADYVSHDDVAALLTGREHWNVRIDRRRPRAVPAGAEGQHTHDDLLIARRAK